MPPTDPIAAVTHADPYPYYAALARERPLYRDDTLNLWVASSPQAIAQVLAHPAARVRPPAEPVPRGLCPAPPALFGRFVRMNDSAEHARLKTLLRAYIDSQPAPDLNGAWPLPRIDAAGVDRYLTLAPVYAQAAFMGLPPDVHAHAQPTSRTLSRRCPPLPTPRASNAPTAPPSACRRACWLICTRPRPAKRCAGCGRTAPRPASAWTCWPPIWPGCCSSPAKPARPCSAMR